MVTGGRFTFTCPYLDWNQQVYFAYKYNLYLACWVFSEKKEQHLYQNLTRSRLQTFHTSIETACIEYWVCKSDGPQAST